MASLTSKTGQLVANQSTRALSLCFSSIDVKGASRWPTACGLPPVSPVLRRDNSGPSQIHRHRMQPVKASAMDVMPVWTLDQIAGLVFGAVMLAAVFGSSYIDKWVARQQRKQLGLCEECGGIYDPAMCQQGKCPSKAKSS